MLKKISDMILQSRSSSTIYPTISINCSAGPLISDPYTPSQIRKAYNFPNTALGEGQTIAIIDAYGNPNLLSDLSIFNQTFNLPPADIEIAYPQGMPTEIKVNWLTETNLDVQWAHALAPYAKILLVISKTDDDNDLYEAVDYAVNAGATIVSMSWGSPETAEITNYDFHFNVPGVAFLASSGDRSSPIYPSTSPYVISVGGTTLRLDNCGNRIGPETSWSFSGGGLSIYEPKPVWQNLCVTCNYTYNFRTTPDVSFLADSLPGVAVFSTIPDIIPNGAWLRTGGTSISAPCWAAILASTKTVDNKFYNIQSKLYNMACSGGYNNPYEVYYDIKIGNNGIYWATCGYDYTTGLGSPNVCKFLNNFF